MEGDRQGQAGDMVLSPIRTMRTGAQQSQLGGVLSFAALHCIAWGTWELVPSAPKHLSLIGSWSISLLVSFISFTAGSHCSPYVLSPPLLCSCVLCFEWHLAGWLPHACSTLKFCSWLVRLSSSSSCQGGRKIKRKRFPKKKKRSLFQKRKEKQRDGERVVCTVDFYILHY